uniref:Uncharacterized protein n=1 Tax=Meloidogyne enterolobii TaxID=390850 RepID=A0A6V7ULU8_MELEN|nr:unnamed protein product [Meloidogyne enterolobii]
MFRDWNKVGNMPQKTIDDMESKLYKIFLFLEKWLLWNGYFANLINNENKLNFKELKKYVENVPNGPSNCEFEDLFDYLNEFTHLLNTENIHFDVFDAIITNSDRMRHFLCDNDIIQIKYFLNGLMGAENLRILEKIHPEVLKIGTL